MMDARYVARLRAARADLRASLVFEHIATELLQEGVLDRDDYQRVASASCDSEKVDRLLDILPEKDSETFNTFIAVLQHDYPWLVNTLQQELPTGEGVRQVTDLGLPENNENNNEADNNNSHKRNCNERNRINETSTTNEDKELTTEMMNIVRRNYRVAQGWTSLAHTLGLTKCINNIRMRVLVYGENSDVCVQYLLEEWVGQRPKEAKLNRLISALREEGFNDVADRLEVNYF